MQHLMYRVRPQGVGGHRGALQGEKKAWIASCARND